MKRFQIITICLMAASAVLADTNELERLRAEYIAARTAYMAARKAAGLTNAAPRRVAAGTTSTVFTKSQKRFFENRRVCVSRDTESVPGSVITTWYRNGKPDTKGPVVVTNVLHSIAGAVQSNPLQGRIAELTAQYGAAVERATSAEARAARLNSLKAWLVEQRDRAVLSTTKAIYQAIIDRLEAD
jgi:hypothetical protein